MPDIDLAALLNGDLGSLETDVGRRRRRVDGVTLGIVTDVNDPRMLGRVKVRFPWISDVVESAWARVAAPWAGGNRGAYLLPEVDDEVLVAFRHGDLGFPYIMGALWSDTARPPEASPQRGRRVLRSRTGHEVVFDDAPGGGSVSIRSAQGHELSLDDAGHKVKLAGAGGTVSVELDTTRGSVTVTASAGDISLSAPAGKVSIQAASLELKATGPISIQSGATVSVNGTLVKLN